MCNMTGNPAYEGYGVINLALWGHDKFRKLSAGQKCLFLYLIAGPETKPSGLFEVTRASMDEVAPYVNITDLFPLVLFDTEDGETFTVYIPGMFEAITDTDTLLDASEQVLAMPDSRLKAKVLEKHKISVESHSRAADGLLAAVSQAIKVSLLQFSPADIRRVHKLGEAGYNAKQVSDLFGWPDGRYYKEDYRWTKYKTKPTLGIIEKSIGPMLEGPAPVDTIDRYRTIQQIIRAAKDNKTASEAKQGFPAKVWQALRKHAKWSTWARMDVDQLKYEVGKALNAEGI